MNYNYKILRISAWLLVAATLLTLFSGFFTTKYFLTPRIGYNLSYYIHTVIVPLVFIPLFWIHTLSGLLALFSRNKSLNKKSFKIIAGLLWTVVIISFIFIYASKPPSFSKPKITEQNGNASSSSANPSTLSTLILDTAEIAKHNSQNDCWLIINGKAYDVTSYLNFHPGGPGLITPYCGKDATQAFATKDAGKPHSQNAENLLSSFYLGNVGQTISPKAVESINSQPPSPAKGGGKGGREDEEDD